VNRLLQLASSSPRRRVLLEGLGFTVEVLPQDIDESPLKGETARACAERLAKDKLRAALPAAAAGAPVLAADTLVVSAAGEILGKPGDRDEARAMLGKLLGGWHEVHTAVAVSMGGDGRVFTAVDTARVHMAHPGEDMLKAYLDGPEPYDKAGAYGVQGTAALWIDRVEGSFHTVMGLPLHLLPELFRRMDAGHLLLPETGR